jgi:putative colanic acid biosynthesis glycosyltransferase WcaI
MRFLIITEYFPPEIGATPIRLLSIARELVNAGHIVEVVTSLPNYPTGTIFPGYRGRLYRREHLEGAEIHRVWVYPALGSGLPRLANYLSFALCAFQGIWRAGPADYIFVESPPLSTAIPGILTAKLKRARPILNVADLWPDSALALGLVREGLLLRLSRRLESWAYRNSAYVTAVTYGIAEQLKRKGVGTDRLLFLPNGVDTELFRPKPSRREVFAEFGVPSGVPIGLYAGIHGYPQGLDTVLDALRELATQELAFHFVFVGDGSERSALKARAAKLSLDNVTFIPSVSLARVAEFWTGADIGYAGLKDLPIFLGARPSKLFPAMAAGKPVIYGGAGEAARIIDEAGAGLVVPPEDPAALAAAFASLIRDPKRAQLLGACGRRYAEQNLSWSVLVDDWLEQLQREGSAMNR